MELGFPKKPIELTDENILNFMDIGIQVLDAQNIPVKGRWLKYWNGEKVVTINNIGKEVSNERKRESTKDR